MNLWLAFALILVWAISGALVAACAAARLRRSPNGDSISRPDWSTGLIWAFAFALVLAGWIAGRAG